MTAQPPAQSTARSALPPYTVAFDGMNRSATVLHLGLIPSASQQEFGGDRDQNPRRVPDNVVAARAVGQRVTRQDNDAVLIPRVEATAKRKIRCYYETGADFVGMG